MNASANLNRTEVETDNEPYTTVIRGGRIVDGTGAPWFMGDVGIRDGIIAKVGHVPGRGIREIDASGLTMTLGFINIHSHLDFTAFTYPLYETSVKQGITTELMGHCGVSAAPIVGNSDTIKQYTIPFWYGLELPWSWGSLGEFLSAIESRTVEGTHLFWKLLFVIMHL